MDSPIKPQMTPNEEPPDVMNDPEYATNNATGEDGAGDVDTCRICRGEGSELEPLFHPCKCSGSIKHVHQDCLMEWLSHSQKKHCELCKTPFRFTKLYSPNMPPTLPTSVFFHHFIIHSARNVATWLRFCLVSIVWLGCLPYGIRQVWRLLFWLSDGGWPSLYLETGNLTFQTRHLAHQFEKAILAENGTSPVTPLAAAQTTSANIGGLVDSIIGIMKPFSSALKINGSDPLIAGIMKSLYYGFGVPGFALPDDHVTNTSDPRLQILMGMAPAIRTTSLLSEVSFFSNLTRNEKMNQVIITIVEGYIITILVVVCFILVFLIREWVVQQQPGINMGAGFDAEFPAERQRDQPALEANDPLRPARPAVENAPDGRDLARPIARARRRQPEVDEQRLRVALAEQPHRLTDTVAGNKARTELGQGESQNRPIPVRDALAPATEIQRQLVEEPRMTEEFLAMWRRAHGVPEEVLRIIETENKVEDMQYWVNAMRVILDPIEQNGSQLGALSPPNAPSHEAVNVNTLTSSLVSQSGSDQGSGASDSWVDVAAPLSYRKDRPSREPSSDINNQSEAAMSGNGKGKAKEHTREPSFNAATPSLLGLEPNRLELASLDSNGKSPALQTTRVRATTDGPHPLADRSHLTRGDWDFSSLSKENDGPDHATTANENFSSTSSSQRPSTQIDLSPGSSAWKVAQALRVQQAIEKGREAHKRTVEESTSSFASVPNQLQDISMPAHGLLDGPMEVVGQDGITRTYQNADELFASNPVNSDSEEEESENDYPGPNPFAPNTPLPPAREPIVQQQAAPAGFLADVADYFWGPVGNAYEEPGLNDEHVVHDIAAEAPFVPVVHDEGFNDADEFPEQEREAVDAAFAAGLDPNDPDALDDAEDFEGIMELIGMRGPMFSLVQNAIFCAVLLALTVAFGIWIPYNIGRITMVLASNPASTFKLPLRLVFWIAAFLQDLFMSVMGVISFGAIKAVLVVVNVFSSSTAGAKWASSALQLSEDALKRVIDSIVNFAISFTEPEIFAFSAIAHEAFLTLKWFAVDTLDMIGRNVIYLFVGNYVVTASGVWQAFTAILQSGTNVVIGIPALLAKPESWVISLEVSKRTAPLDLELSIWSGTDRFWATLTGYTALSVLGILYVNKGTPFSNGQIGREWEASIIDSLHQAGGVMKVILIISIEMLVFPLYCGLLLDAALLPLFDNTTIVSRILFTFNSPLTSIFVHWFVGTCYMFHFALFVSMCRKIMRKGVLYFIRDPDDPTFHPVRDVLERNVATQLRKILFSALVYGALVVVCLGGVVWGLSYAFKGVLPIHWSSNEPVLEFPVDLLFYNFLMPLAVRFFKPSDGLHAMYSWWFRQCARMLRLTWFMFDERRLDEEGYNVRRSWRDFFSGAQGDPLRSIQTDDLNEPFIQDPAMAAYFCRDGRYVRAPASDQVRVPKGTRIFLQVDDQNNRLDGKWDAPDGIHGRDSELYKQVYIPPHFRMRICVFIVSIWVFAALTGVSITIIPLVFGRYVFAKIIPGHVRKNDVYAFSIGIYILGSALYAILHLKSFFDYLVTASLSTDTPKNIVRSVAVVASRVVRILWTYSAFLFLLPTLFAFVIEFYAILPLHTYFVPTEPHTIHFVQSWTLGLLYVKLTTRIILAFEDSRPAIALRAITRNGYLDPNARLATRSFIVPASSVLGVAIAWPWLLARMALMTIWKSKTEAQAVLIYRYVYPAVLVAACVGVVVSWLLSCVKSWRMRIRDEVYLIGERLHNFGERKSGAGGVGSVVVARRIET